MGLTFPNAMLALYLKFLAELFAVTCAGIYNLGLSADSGVLAARIIIVKHIVCWDTLCIPACRLHVLLRDAIMFSVKVCVYVTQKLLLLAVLVPIGFIAVDQLHSGLQMLLFLIIALIMPNMLPTGYEDKIPAVGSRIVELGIALAVTGDNASIISQ